MPDAPISCVICKAAWNSFLAAKQHISFAPDLQSTRGSEWILKWSLYAPDPRSYPPPHKEAKVQIIIKHKGGYGWGIGGFTLYPNRNTQAEPGSYDNGEGGPDHSPIITDLDATPVNNNSPARLDYSKTLGSGSLAAIGIWATERASKHTRCNKIFGKEGIAKPVAPWFPDRLVKMTLTQDEQGEPDLRARVVVKSGPNDFPADQAAQGITYISLSHSWGPAPNPGTYLDGRAGTVLTDANLPAWQQDLPLDDLPLTFQHAVQVCFALGFVYIWIDSPCIIQDSLADWRAQSAVMGDVYKHAWLNIAALCSASDNEGFVVTARDPRIEFGFRVPFATVLGRSAVGEYDNGSGGGGGRHHRECVLLLRGAARVGVPGA
jgi:hypothetical protein